jgi:hypothetical protein
MVKYVISFFLKYTREITSGEILGFWVPSFLCSFWVLACFSRNSSDHILT